MSEDSHLRAKEGPSQQERRFERCEGMNSSRRSRRLGENSRDQGPGRQEAREGGHQTLYFGERKTVLRNPKDELKTGTYHAMLRQLGISEKDLG